MDPVNYPTLNAGLQHSRYLQRVFTRNPALAEHTAASLGQPFARADMESALEGLARDDDNVARQRLRALRTAVMARLICRELAGLSNLDEAVSTVSDLAEVTVAAALANAQAQTELRYGQPIGEETGTPQQLIVVGMGKLGGRELNVSSDIDLIFVYPEDGETTGPRQISNHEYFAYVGKALIQLIAQPTDDGFVFRVDMRLRPFGDAGPLVSSFAALENYLLTQGREWERYAWIKGRALTGDADALMQLVTPFVYRKYLDYGAYRSMRELHSQIRHEVLRKDRYDNIKLGPGGIREVEFIGQVFQLIRGGRDKPLRERPTRTILNELARQGLIPADAVRELLGAYTFLRNVEHRLMYIDDAQTQTLPTGDDDSMRLARSMGFVAWDQFYNTLAYWRSLVSRHFEQVFTAPQSEDENHPQAALWQHAQEGEGIDPRLAELGYKDPPEIRRRLAAMQNSGRYQQMPERSRQRMDSILPPLIEVAAGYPNPDATLSRILDLLEAISRRESYLALLAEHPQTLKRLASLYSASDWVSSYLTRHPILLDELLDVRLLYQAPDWTELGRQLRAQMQEHADDTEARMDLLRNFQHTQVFRLVAQDIAGHLPLETLSDHLSDLADLCLQVTLEQTWRDLNKKHCETPSFAVIGYGKLGGKELGYASDLDLVFLYQDEHPDASETYGRYAKRVVNWLTTLTPAGLLYDIDLRLRPNGASGFLVSSIDAFIQYQNEAAWMWEHQALSRARYAAGDAEVGKAFERVRCEVLRRPRDIVALRAEVRDMRQRMRETHPDKPDDVKHRRGGIVDVEFIVQFLVLGYAHQFVDLTANRGNIALLGTAAEHGLIEQWAAEDARVGYRELRRLQHTSRLSGTTPSAETLEGLGTYMASIRHLWQTLFEDDAEA
ncbi:bifunctional [glutamate--ammonia ligase]-adenylyl-L-tyrosine phosphorylase/[glutamate--ammonia-ligase] adenylyltransferase [Amantichitinum ursilacus]|uniref:Bifunctional glutamine synthetase adenylyltransferase/adenylyl-removing enzyme n=1 Tax=Amantichitinum ursilacus TaxID=857265 RepID=A0A0N0GQJ1_9NEIS|nr:bifunctional [glutamate--ammonia ligase]-adenylyl-L-tyrosine phosphorylase/[glutamate--ammonia-ligase] adenylyltransferase [Amantichitinum ursilacus]KPC54511.1 Glutamate-ammonia-ligase adenylyltransferase [Amantichitinum ursilacus]